MDKFYIYKIINTINNKIYIGKAKNVNIRWQKHLYTVKYGEKKYGFSYLHSAIKKYGANNFTFKIIEECDNEISSFEREKFLILQYNSNDRNIGYNLTVGGEGVSGRIVTKEEKEKRSLFMKNYWQNNIHPNFGKKISSKHKEKISLANTNKVVSDQTKKKISEKNSGNNNGMYGKTYTREQRINKSIKTSETKKKNPTKCVKFTQETIEKLKVAVKEKRSRKLSDEQKDKIIDLYNSGTIIKRELAILFDVEEKTVQYVIRYWEQIKNNKSKHLTEYNKNKIIELYLSKLYTKKQISEIIGIPFNRVEAVIKMYQIKQKYNEV